MRYARFALAVLFALLTLGFVALWARSYWWLDHRIHDVGATSGVAVFPNKDNCDCGLCGIYRAPNAIIHHSASCSAKRLPCPIARIAFRLNGRQGRRSCANSSGLALPMA
jgi:hypothetical protein